MNCSVKKEFEFFDKMQEMRLKPGRESKLGENCARASGLAGCKKSKNLKATTVKKNSSER